jgi:hypothetical protein
VKASSHILSTSHEETTSDGTTKPDNDEATTRVKHERSREHSSQRELAHRPKSTLEIRSVTPGGGEVVRVCLVLLVSSASLPRHGLLPRPPPPPLPR